MSNKVIVETIWLQERVDDASSINAAIDTLGRIPPNDSDDYDFLLDQARRGDRSAAFQLAKILVDDRSVPRWLGLGWLWVAACRGFKDAQMLLARELAHSATDAEPSGTPSKLLRMSLNWLNGQLPVCDVAADEAKRVSAGQGDLPSRCVLSRIGDPQSRDGRDLQARFSHMIGRQIGFAGTVCDPKALRDAIDEIWPWATDVSRHIAGQIALQMRAFDSRIRLRPLLVVGPPGCGKTSILEWCCEQLQLPRAVIACAGANDASGLAAVTRGWSTSRPCVPFQLMAESGCVNPVVIMDELDKGAPLGGQNGSVMGAVINMLGGSGKYFDGCLMAEVDLSYVSFLATANNLSALPTPLRDRFTVVRVPSPRPEHFPVVLAKIVADTARDIGVDRAHMPALSEVDQLKLLDIFVLGGQSIRVLQRAYSSFLDERMNMELDQLRFLN